MPIYEYRCEKGHNFEVLQSMSDDPVATCEECGAPVERVLHPVSIHFKRSGFYTTDYGKGGVKRPAGNGDASSKADSNSSEKKDSKSGSTSTSDSSSKSESKADKKPATSSD